LSTVLKKIIFFYIWNSSTKI